MTDTRPLVTKPPECIGRNPTYFRLPLRNMKVIIFPLFFREMLKFTSEREHPNLIVVIASECAK